MSRWTGQYHGNAVWSIVAHSCETPDPQQDSSPRRCQKRAKRCCRNSIFGTAKFKAYNAIQGKYRRHTRQSHRVWMDRPVPWKRRVEHRGHGCETPDPQQDCSPRRCQKRVQRCSRNSIFGTADYKAYKAIYKANIQGIEGKAIDVWMDRPVPWKSPVENCRAWLRNTGSQAGFKPKAVPEACAEMLSK